MFNVAAMTRKLRSGGLSDPHAPAAKRSSTAADAADMVNDLDDDTWADRANNLHDPSWNEDQAHPIAGVHIAAPARAAAKTAPTAESSNAAGAQRRQRGGRATPQEDDEPWMRDWQLSDKDLSAHAMKQLLVMVSQLSPQHALKIKILASIGIDVEDIPNSSEMGFIELSKQDTSEYAKTNSTLPLEMRQTMPPPFVLVWKRVVEWGKGVIAKDPHKWAEAAQLFAAYEEQFSKIEDQNERALAVAATVRYCRIRTTFRKERRILEVAAHLETGADKVWEQLRLMMETLGATRKHGIAPKSGIERRVEKVLKKLRAGNGPAK
jgi:hypothetical protein